MTRIKIVFALSAVFFAAFLFWPGAANAEDQIALGEKIYRQGIGGNGEPIEAIVQGDLLVLGTEFTCVSCHMRAGLGSLEGGVITTPTTGTKLYAPYNGPEELPMASLSRLRRLFMAPPARPAYDDELLRKALLDGVDPAGRKLDPVMPRYNLGKEDMDSLIAYLKSLSSKISEGVTGDTINIATVITDDVSAADREALLKQLNGFVKVRNNLLNYYKTALKSGNRTRLKMLAKDLDLESLKYYSLSVWDLKGPPEGWKAQLEEYYRKKPVFYLLSGISNSDWKPVHEFCEANRLPCILPITDYPVVSNDSWYTLYFSKGFSREAEAAARFLGKLKGLPRDAKIVQIFRDDRRGRAISEAFDGFWVKSGGMASVKLLLKSGEVLDSKAAADFVAKEKPAATLVWLGDEAMELVDSLAGGGKEELVMVSASIWGEALWNIPDSLRPNLYVTYPYKLPKELPQPVPDRKGKTAPPLPPFGEASATTRATAAVKLANEVAASIKSNFYGDYVFDLIDMMGQLVFSGGGMGSMGGPVSADFGRLGFGPGQRYAAKGCYIVKVAPTGKMRHVNAVSDWVIH